MDVTDVLRDRRSEPDGLGSMAAVSLALHAGILAFLIFGPMNWLSSPAEPPKSVMTISLAGAGEGVRSGGLTAIGGRPVQTTEPAPVREAIRPPAATVPEMVTPKATAKDREADEGARRPHRRRRRARRAAGLRRAARKCVPGNALADTGARGQGFGLSTGGGAGSGSRLDVANFCCPEYIVLMVDKIRSNWNQRVEVPGAIVVKFTIQRDGRLTETVVEQSSGTLSLDQNAQRAVMVTRQLTPLPAAFPNPTLTVFLNFEYSR